MLGLVWSWDTGRLVSRGHVGSLSLDGGGSVDKGGMFGVVVRLV